MFKMVLDCGLFHAFDDDERTRYVASLASVTEQDGTPYVSGLSDDRPMTMTATVKAMDSQRWVCRIHLFQFNGTSSRLLSRLRRPVGRFNAELLCVLGVQSLPALELHGLGADDAADGSSAEKVIQHIETNVPPGSTHCDEGATDVGPQRQARAATQGFEFP